MKIIPIYNEVLKKYAYKDIDTDTFVTEFIFDEAKFLYNEVGLVSINNKYGFIDNTGKILLPLIYDYAGYFGLDNIANVKIGYFWKQIDKNGNILGDMPGVKKIII